jgi:hypothetical protein
MSRSIKKLSTISGETPDNCPFIDRSFARCSRKARAFSFSLRLRAEYPGTALIRRLDAGAPFSHSTSPAMVPTSIGIAATVEEGTAPKPVQVIARVQRYSGDARLMSVSGAENPGSDTTQMPGLSPRAPAVFSTLPFSMRPVKAHSNPVLALPIGICGRGEFRLSTMRGVGFRSRSAAPVFSENRLRSETSGVLGPG